MCCLYCTKHKLAPYVLDSTDMCGTYKTPAGYIVVASPNAAVALVQGSCVTADCHNAIRAMQYQAGATMIIETWSLLKEFTTCCEALGIHRSLEF